MKWMRALVGLALEVSMVALGALILWQDDDSEITWGLLIAWDVVAALYLMIFFVSAFRRRNGEVRPVADLWDRVRWGGMFHSGFAVLISLVGLVAGAEVLFGLRSKDAGDQLTSKTLGVVTVVLAWLMLQCAYSRFYAWVYRHRRPGSLEFPGTPNPGDVDFIYFAFALGSTFATSDVSVTDTRMRWHVTGHSILAFFYNAAVMAIAFKVLTGG